MINRCLFLDDLHISRREGLELRAHPAKRYPGNPLMTKKFPWEATRLQLYGRCIVYNEQRKLFQMFYIAQPRGSHYPNLLVGGERKVGHTTIPAYAESQDGIHWERPLLSEVSFEDIAQTNLLDLRVGQSFEAGILWDPHDPDPQRRYKALVWDQNFQMPLPGRVNYVFTPQGTMQQILDEEGKVIFEEPYDDWGMLAAFSPDGIHWSKHPGWVLPCYSDTGNSVLYDPRLGKFVAFGRFNSATITTKTAGGETAGFAIGRNVGRIESDDFIHWSEPELVLAADADDPSSFQINSMPVDLYQGIYMGLMEVDVRPFPEPHRPLQLAASHDGRTWTRLGDRCAFLEPPAGGAWDDIGPSGWVRPATGLFDYADQVRFYYSGGTMADSFFGVGMAYWRRDGFVSLHAGEAAGELLTRAFVPDAPLLHLNVDASHGEVTVQVCDHQGKPVEGWKVSAPSLPISGDHLDIPVRWEESDFEKLLGRAVTLRIRMRNADLYSFWTAC